ncbi:dipeptidase [Promethearchaeum syntrophicum]|uniref:Dipeptidase n=1 Tax=Promethearchaeum syntrophicum TaxID=2594042 RepID=A0A5B9D816_9ARCH|nr:membrane dipeptidase [Candidatus Prometheoarchaeum syntrophicum]QEE15151.1 Membrane dipeptidase (Peptidase family M19) [Candidatus Prometheoarchaeum syntrophicum]
MDIKVIDGHIDTLLALKQQGRTFSQRSDKGHCDLHRMKEGNVSAALFAIWPGMTKKNLINGMDAWFKLLNNPENQLYHIKNIDDFSKAENSKKIGAILHFEGAGGIDKDFALLRLGYQLGLRSMGLSWSNVNKFATGALFEQEQEDRGLTELGKELLHTGQKMGITIDVSHLNDPSFWDAIEITRKPLIASHSNCRSICSHQRNLTDKQIIAIHEKHGTIGLNLSVIFLSEEHKKTKIPVELPFEVLKSHIDHIVKITDINTVAIGTDFDGTTVPTNLSGVNDLPLFFNYLLENGYSEQDLKKLGSENLLRVFKDTWI